MAAEIEAVVRDILDGPEDDALSYRQIRYMVEEKLGLAEKALSGRKDEIRVIVDRVNEE